MADTPRPVNTKVRDTISLFCERCGNRLLWENGGTYLDWHGRLRRSRTPREVRVTDNVHEGDKIHADCGNCGRRDIQVSLRRMDAATRGGNYRLVV
jgi:predicted SprT family Zn-dependent metalloprotease